MLRLLGRRGLEACISAFALLGFCYVPLGQHTGLEHAKAVFSTPAAKRAGSELIEAFAHLRSKLTGEAVEFANGDAEPTPSSTPSAPRPDGSRSERAHHGSEPRPRAPRLGPDSNAHEAPREGSNDANAPDASAPWHAS